MKWCGPPGSAAVRASEPVLAIGNKDRSGRFRGPSTPTSPIPPRFRRFFANFSGCYAEPAQHILTALEKALAAAMYCFDVSKKRSATRSCTGSAFSIDIGRFYTPQPVQRKFHASEANYPLLEGGRGGRCQCLRLRRASIREIRSEKCSVYCFGGGVWRIRRRSRRATGYTARPRPAFRSVVP